MSSSAAASPSPNRNGEDASCGDGDMLRHQEAAIAADSGLASGELVAVFEPKQEGAGRKKTAASASSQLAGDEEDTMQAASKRTAPLPPGMSSDDDTTMHAGDARYSLRGRPKK